ncbi:MAG: polyphosphate polymerase domain-containing protein [Patescibacteria group bacterium]|nr:polyphosphate polymerase domain-containing protein [Patescibacteria group bacterium]MDD5490168.1 polyphosphate polymerase domain-containing protein [Patescibacteria group bacterium]
MPEKKNFLPREEYKYYVPLSAYPFLLQDLKKFVLRDKNAPKSGVYQVASIYFENMALRSYFDKIEGQARKIKLRLRFYPLDAESQLNIEFKYKILDQCLKVKTRVDPALLPKILADKPLPPAQIKNDPVLWKFLEFKKINNFWPFIRIDYKREAFFAQNDRDIRITFDYDVRCCRSGSQELCKPFIPALPPGTKILEIKTPGRFPFWLAYLIKKYSLRKTSISKYSLAVQNMALNSSLSVK